MTERSAERSTAWGTVAVVFGAGAVATWITAAAVQSAFASWAITASLLSLLTALGLYMTFASSNDWPTIGRRNHLSPKTDDHPIRGRGGGLRSLLPSFPPLTMKLEDEEWELWQSFIWIAALKIRISNASMDKRVIRLRQFSVESDLGYYKPPKPTKEQATAVFQETIKRGETYTAHIRMMDLEPRDSMSGWYVTWVSLSEDGGRPRCRFVVTDAAGDTYELVIPARPRQTHRMPGTGL